MTPLNYNFIRDVDAETLALLQETQHNFGTCNKSSLEHPLYVLPNAITPDGSEFFPLLNAYKAKWENKGTDVLRFRVLGNDGGITITVPCTKGDLLYLRYRSILQAMRNSRVSISFPEIEVYSMRFGLYFVSRDFKLKSTVKSNEEAEISLPAPTIYI